MKGKTDESNPFVNWACGIAALLVQLLNQAQPAFVFQPSLKTAYLPFLNISAYDALALYFTVLMFFGGLAAFVIMLSNTSVKVGTGALCYFAGWVFGWCLYLLRWLL